MSFLKNIKPNKPTANLEGYFMAMLAKSKYGKTTFAIDLVREHYKGDMSKGLLLATEIGFKTHEGIYAIPITGFDYAEDDNDEEQRGFIEVVDELIENKNDIPFKFIIIDTITALERQAIQYAIRKCNREDSPEKRYTDVSDIPWGKGYNRVAEEIYKQIERLKTNGFGVLIIGHEKVQRVKQKDGFEYDYITFNALGKTVDIIEREADMIIYGEMNMVKENDSDELDLDSDEDDSSSKATMERSLRFRSDGNIVCGTRFRTFPDTIEHDPVVFLKTFEETILSLYGGKKSEVAKARKQESKVKEDKTVKATEKKDKKDSLESVKEDITKLVKKMDKETRGKVAKIMKDNLGIVNYMNSDDLDNLKKSLKLVKEL